MKDLKNAAHAMGGIFICKITGMKIALVFL